MLPWIWTLRENQVEFGGKRAISSTAKRCITSLAATAQSQQSLWVICSALSLSDLQPTGATRNTHRDTQHIYLHTSTYIYTPSETHSTAWPRMCMYHLIYERQTHRQYLGTTRTGEFESWGGTCWTAIKVEQTETLIEGSGYIKKGSHTEKEWVSDKCG